MLPDNESTADPAGVSSSELLPRERYVFIFILALGSATIAPILFLAGLRMVLEWGDQTYQQWNERYRLWYFLLFIVCLEIFLPASTRLEKTIRTRRGKRSEPVSQEMLSDTVARYAKWPLSSIVVALAGAHIVMDPVEIVPDTPLEVILFVVAQCLIPILFWLLIFGLKYYERRSRRRTQSTQS